MRLALAISPCSQACAICCTFWLWTRSIRTPDSWPWGILTGLSYIYMVAAWGGYIFVLNMIAFHAVALVAMGRYTPKLHKAYTLFYVIGTYGAIQVPVVGLTPLKSMEQLGALGVFGIIQLMWIASIIRDMKDPSHKWDEKQVLTLRAAVFGAAAVGSVVVIMILAPMGYFGRFRGRAPAGLGRCLFPVPPLSFLHVPDRHGAVLL